MQGGLDPSESDPRFHQQMVYAVAMKTLENFDRALGRCCVSGPRIESVRPPTRACVCSRTRSMGRTRSIRPDLNGILFGYFNADAVDPGPNLPGQVVFTCLSHDIIAHEMTHAIVDRLRPLFLEPSNVDVLAFHEGFADIVALFQHFSYPEVVRDQIQRTRTDIRTPNALVQLAQQFGYATGSGKALRSALAVDGAKLRPTIIEPHERGSILVAAVFDAFFKTYQRRIVDLIRIATGGTGTLPQGDLHPDLVTRIANEAVRTAQRVLDMCIRAFDYMPPVDVTFGDFLRAMITADYELVPDDDLECRSAMIEAFRQRGIYADGVASLAEESLLWNNVERQLPSLSQEALPLMREVFFNAVRAFDGGWTGGTDASPSNPAGQSVTMDEGEEIDLDVNEEFAKQLKLYAEKNADGLSLSRSFPIQVRGFHTVFRVAPNGRLLVELVAQFAQADHSLKGDLGGIPFRGGCTLVASSDGQVRYLISKPMHKSEGPAAWQKAGQARLRKQQDYLQLCDMRSPLTPYASEAERRNRMLGLMSFAALHEG